MNDLEQFCRDFSLLPHLDIYSIIHFYQYGLINTYFILWVTIQYYIILLLDVPAVATGNLSQLTPGSFCPNPIIVVLCLWGTFLLSGTRTCKRLILNSLCSGPRISHFPESPSGSGNQDLGTGWQFLFKGYYYISDSASCFFLREFPYLCKKINRIILNLSPTSTSHHIIRCCHSGLCPYITQDSIYGRGPAPNYLCALSHFLLPVVQDLSPPAHTGGSRG